MAGRKLHYGWAVCAACALLLFCVGGLSTTGFSAYQPYLISVGGLTNTQASSVILFRTLFTMIGMFFVTRLIHLLEIRRLVTIAMVISAISFFLYGFADSFAEYCAAASLAGAALGIGGMVPVSVVIARWFNEHRGLALGICMAATGFSAIVASPYITLMVNKTSLRATFLFEGAFVLVSALVVYHILRSRPSCMHVEAIGAHHNVEGRHVYAKHSAPKGLYFGMMAGVFLFGIPGNTLYSHISVLYRSVGMDEMKVSALLSIFGTALMVGKCAYGQVADRFGTWRSSWLLYACTAVGTALSCMAGNGSYGIAVTAMILMGFGLAVTTVSLSMYAAGVSTEEQYSKTVTRFQVLTTLGSLAFSAVPGILADRYGNYIPAFQIMLVIAVISAWLLQTAYHTIRKIDVSKG